MALMIDIEKPKDCKECPFMGTDGIGTLSPMMCIAIWSRSHEVKHCIKGKIRDDCPLREIPSGKWEHITYYDGGFGMNETCSNCGHTIHGQIFDLVDKYCPNCGTKMESEDKEWQE